MSFQPPSAAQVQCQLNDATCHRVAAYILDHITPWIADRSLTTAVEAQNLANAKLTNLEIDKLDIGWIDRSDKALIDSKMNHPLTSIIPSSGMQTSSKGARVRDGLGERVADGLLALVTE